MATRDPVAVVAPVDVEFDNTAINQRRRATHVPVRIQFVPPGILRSSAGKASQQDKNFQGFGRFTTGSTGEYYFRTIKPLAYPGKVPHIHVKVKKGGKELLTTQILVADNPQNKNDGVFRGAGGILERELLLAEFKPIKESKIGELSANFNIVLGKTPADKD